MCTATLQPLRLPLMWLRVIFPPPPDLRGLIAETVLHAS